MTITEFLTARLDEDEAVARRAQGEPGSGDFSWWDVDYNSMVAEAHGTRWKPERILADIAAKRAIVEMHQEMRRSASQAHYAGREGEADVARNMYAGVGMALNLLAQPYAEHPDFDPAWRVA